MARPTIVRLRSKSSTRVALGRLCSTLVFASRSCRIFSRSSAPSHLAFSGWSNQISQASSQTNPVAPTTTKEPRQPIWLMIQATSKAPIAGPACVPAMKIALVMPRSPAGIHSRTTRPPAGKVVASPTPMASRVPISETKFHDAPVSMVAADQIVMPAALMALVPSRSTRIPIGMRQSR